MSVSNRYQPEFAPGESCNVGLDFSTIIPPGVGVKSSTFSVFTNSADPQPADTDFSVGPVEVRGRVVYVLLSGGVAGRDYQLRFTAQDSEGNIWPRTALLLCANTS